MRPTSSACAVIAALSLLSGCDDWIGYDVAPDGRLIVPLDAEGRAELTGDGTKPRDLVLIDSRTGKRAPLTKKSGAFAAPLALPGGGAVAVEERKRLVVIAKDGERRVLATTAPKQTFLLPALSPDGRRVAVTESAQWAAPEAWLRVYDIDAAGDAEAGAPDALPGGAWVGPKTIVFGSYDAATRNAKKAELPSRIADGVLMSIARDVKAPSPFRRVAPATLSFIAPVTPLDDTRALVVTMHKEREDLVLATLDLASGALAPIDLGKGSVAFACASPDKKRVLLTRSRENEGSLEGELLLAPAGDIAAAKPVATPKGASVSAPRWISDDRIAFFAGDALIAQNLEGGDRVVLVKAVLGKKEH